MSYKYWLPLRPAMPGSVPSKNLKNIENFDERTYNEKAGREVWGYVEYSEPLTDEQVEAYELIEAREEE